MWKLLMPLPNWQSVTLSISHWQNGGMTKCRSAVSRGPGRQLTRMWLPGQWFCFDEPLSVRNGLFKSQARCLRENSFWSVSLYKIRFFEVPPSGLSCSLFFWCQHIYPLKIIKGWRKWKNKNHIAKSLHGISREQ